MTALPALLFTPFIEFAFMRRALVAGLALAVGYGPIGVLLVLRRMSLVGDAMAHAVLPGAAIGFLAGGLSLPAMSLGGFVAGLVVALLAGLVTRLTALREDTNFAAFYLISLALGVLIVSTNGSNLDLIHILFGTILAVDEPALLLVAGIATTTIVVLALIYRPLVLECVDPGYLKALGGNGPVYHFTLLVLVVLNLVGGFQALGTLMAVGAMMLPAASARLWTIELWSATLLAMGLGLLAGYAGLLLSFHADLPSGPAIVLVAGGIYVVSLLAGTRGSLRTRCVAGRRAAREMDLAGRHPESL